MIRRSLSSASLLRLLILMLCAATLAFVWDMLFFAKPVDMAQGLGASLALAGIYLGATSRK